MKSERGSITLFVLIAMIFFLVIAMTAYVSASNKLKGQSSELESIKAGYEQDLDEDKLFNLYGELTNTEEGYVKNGLILHYDAINNTGNGHSATATTWKDLSGNGNDGTIYGVNNTVESGWHDNYIALDGVDDYVNINPDELQDLPQGTVSIDFELLDYNDDQEYDTLFFKGNGANWVNNHIQISEYSKQHKFCTTISNNTKSTSGSLLTDVNEGEHKQIVLEWDGLEIKSFANGNINSTLNNNLYPANNSTVCYLGRTINGWNRHLKCKIKSVKIYNRALSDKEIAHNYNVDRERFNIQ